MLGEKMMTGVFFLFVKGWESARQRDHIPPLLACLTEKKGNGVISGCAAEIDFSRGTP